jgi:hypothetical protein
MRYWALGEFLSEEAVLQAARQCRQAGHAPADLYSPYPVEGADEVLGLPASPIPRLAFSAAIFGAGLAYLAQWFANVYDWPLNIGGRPPHAFLMFVPVSYETMILTTATVIFGALLALYRFPEIYHPVLSAPAFKSASVGSFWLALTSDEKTDLAALAQVLIDSGAGQITVVEADA